MAHSAAVQELDSILQSLQSLKPPGVIKSKVDSATKLCTNPQNTAIEPALVDCISNSFRRSPDTHKLGILYIVDSVTRQWVASGATHASGVRKITDALPDLINDYIPRIPEAQKDKLGKLLDIWLSSKTFPAGMLTDFKIRLQNPQMPPQQYHPAPQQAAPGAQQPPPANAASLLAALSAPPPAPPAPPMQQQGQNAVMNNQQANMIAAFLAQAQNNPQALPPALPYQQQQAAPISYPPPQQAPQQQSAGPFQYGNVPPIPSPSNPNPLAGFMQMQQAPPPAQDPNAAANQLQILQQLAQNPEALKTVMQALGIPLPPMQSIQAPQAPPQLPIPVPGMPQNGYQYNAPAPQAVQQAPTYGRNDGYDARERSRSPDRRRNSPPNRRESPTYGTYDPRNPNNGQNDRRGRKEHRDYRQRSPPGRDSREDQQLPPNSLPKPVGYDNSLPEGQIKVLSRTLFVGGVKTSESDLKAFFRSFGTVQSCIVNHDKRHAFLKMLTHSDAMNTKQGVMAMSESEYRHMFERVNWAVGFGPTQCADYQIGESKIPLELLTDADRKWMLTAEYGGTGGNPIAGGMVVEEPDIEIGAGPSSKAIHRRGGGTGRGGSNFGGGGRRGGNNNNNHNNENGQQRFRKQDQQQQNVEQNHHHQQYQQNHHPQQVIAAPPPVPGFGAPIPGFPGFNFR